MELRKILDIRSCLNKENSIDNLEALKIRAIGIRDKILFNDDKESAEDLVIDIELKIDSIKRSVLKPNQEDLTEAVKPIIGPPQMRIGRPSKTRYVQGIIPSTRCSITLSPNCTMREVEKEVIRIALLMNNDNRNATSEMLGLSVRTLRNKINEYLDNGEVGTFEVPIH